MHTGRTVAQDDAGRELLFDDLPRWERQLRVASLDEAMRLLAFDKFHKLTQKEIRCIAEYGSIQIDQEVFFQFRPPSARAKRWRPAWPTR
jgi:hypothetical protein